MHDEMKNQEDRSSLFQTVEQIRAERYPHIDRALVVKILNLHCDPESPPLGLASAIDNAIATQLGETA